MCVSWAREIHPGDLAAVAGVAATSAGGSKEEEELGDGVKFGKGGASEGGWEMRRKKKKARD